jgi:hypothetical protein
MLLESQSPYRAPSAGSAPQRQRPDRPCRYQAIFHSLEEYFGRSEAQMREEGDKSNHLLKDLWEILIHAPRKGSPEGYV